MEDYGVQKILSDRVRFVIVCDGHGSVPVKQGRFIGGYECAKFVCLRLQEHITQFFSSGRLFNDVHKCITIAFDLTQRELIHEIAIKYSDSKIDGFHFKTEQTSNPHFTKKNKLIQDIDILYYHIKPTFPLVEYGTTATLFLVIDNHAYIASVGDSDVYCYRNSKKPSSSNIINKNCIVAKVTTEQSVRSEKERKRIKQRSKGRCEISQEYFVFEVPHYGKFSIMPSRSFGHYVLSQLGITHKPSIVDFSIHKNDCFVIGSDGLWERTWIHHAVCKFINEKKTPEEIAIKISEIIKDETIVLREHDYYKVPLLIEHLETGNRFAIKQQNLKNIFDNIVYCVIECE